MKDHGQQIIQLVALVIIIAAIVTLRAIGTPMSDVGALGLAVALGNLTSGLSPGPANRPAASLPNEPAAQPQKANQ